MDPVTYAIVLPAHAATTIEMLLIFAIVGLIAFALHDLRPKWSFKQPFR